MSHLLRVAWLTYGIVYIYRHTFGIYLYDVEPFTDYWRDGPMANSPMLQHLLSVGTAAIIFVPTLVVHFLYDLIGAPPEVVGWLFSYAYTFSMALVVYHLLWAMLAALFHNTVGRRFWSWTSSMPGELLIATVSVYLSLQP